jgi:osmotically inducible protein OsmC
MMDRKGMARWEGDLKSGKGTIRVGSGGFSAPYSFGTRFGIEAGTNPEELIGAAHAACFSMALSGGLSKAGFVPRSIETTATVRVEKVGDAWSITGIELDCHADVPNVPPDTLSKAAADASGNCPVSKALASVPITLRMS